ncbi:hypothetical protein P4C99_21805 [Pontiellaceae bacterium B1224]|nr:hypothetical protein [Pontiellaceae bacterium B1224]
MDEFFRTESDFFGSGVQSLGLKGDELKAWLEERKKFIRSDTFYVQFRKLSKAASDESDFWELVMLSSLLQEAWYGSGSQTEEITRLKCDYIKLLSEGLGADQYENAKRAYCVVFCRTGSGKKGDSEEAAKFLRNLYKHGFDSCGAVRLELVDEYIMWKFGLEEKELKGSSEIKGSIKDNE